MKLSPQRLPAFLQNPGDCRVVLLFGEDSGMIRQRAETLVRGVAGSLDDPFLVVELPRADAEQLPDHAASLSLTGGRRVIRIRDATDAAARGVQAVLASRAPALVVLEGADLPTRSKLRTMLDAAPDGVAIGCYPEEGRALETTIRATLSLQRVEVDGDALHWLAAQLGADQMSTQAELQKLALYAGAEKRIDLDMAMACVGDLASLSLDDALAAATSGNVAGADRALELAMAEGASPVGVIRAALMHLQRLHRTRLQVDAGATVEDAMRSLRPPVFFRRSRAFAAAVGNWSSSALTNAMAALTQAERNCKRTGAPDEVLCRAVILTLARRANAAG
jgi:DNA polymerase-3 subunit delta